MKSGTSAVDLGPIQTLLTKKERKRQAKMAARENRKSRKAVDRERKRAAANKRDRKQ